MRWMVLRARLLAAACEGPRSALEVRRLTLLYFGKCQELIANVEIFLAISFNL
jgi:hypothetical protein